MTATTTKRKSGPQPLTDLPPGYVGRLVPSTWTDEDRRAYANTAAMKRQRGRTIEFEQAWKQCWYYFAKTFAKGEVVTHPGAVPEDWDKAALLYNLLLMKARARGMRFRLSDAGIDRPTIRRLVRGLKRKEYLSEAEDVLVRSAAIRITDRSKGGDDYTVELLRPPSKVSRGQSFVSAWNQPFVSMAEENEKLHWRDNSLDGLVDE